MAKLLKLSVPIDRCSRPSAATDFVQRDAADLAYDRCTLIHHREFESHAIGVVANNAPPRKRHKNPLGPASRVLCGFRFVQRAGRVKVSAMETLPDPGGADKGLQVDGARPSVWEELQGPTIEIKTR